ncbi:hypothetical protein VTN96DRAFT_9461 [Rasamsonia emersonii]
MDTLSSQARQLLEKTVSNYTERYGVGLMSDSIYDTAWVSLIQKEVDGHRQWLFPEAFDYLLDRQGENGGWQVGGPTIDGILNTAASLLSLKRHLSEPLQMQSFSQQDLNNRIVHATASLDEQLQEWDVENTQHVGFEILVPALLELLEKEGISFTFPDKNTLDRINRIKLAKFKPEVLYSPVKTTALHSLEAFVGKADFDRLAHHTVHGSMMGSPSSTAAYLMYVSRWDDAAEAYLRHVFERGNGGWPGAYPTTYFTFTWILSTLLEAGFTREDLSSSALDKMETILERGFEEEQGLLGFAPQLGSDADDTAKAILTLNCLGKAVSPDSLIREYETLTHFRTYAFERDPSFSANFNVLIALLHVSDPAKYCPQIEKCARFLCKLAWETDGFVRDKWNLSRYYSIMLMVQAFTDLLELWSNGPLSAIPDDLIRDRAYILLFQSVHRIMLSQEDDGSWNHSREETSYAICTLLKASTLPFWELFASELKLAIARGREFLQSSPADKPGYLWIAKVTYASDVLSESYVLAALRTPTALHRIRTGSLEPSEHTISRIENYIPFYRQTPLLASVPEWQLRASLFEGYLFQPALRRRRLDVFPRKNMPEDKYFEYIPFTWTGCSNRNRTFASADFLFEMMVLSFLNYQADEHMEAAGRRYAGDLSGLSQMIDEVFQRPAAGEADTTEDDIRGPLTKFVRYFLTHPRVLQASEFDRASLRRELKRYLLAQVAQTEDSRLLQETRQGKTATTWESFFHWVRSTAADNSSCPGEVHCQRRGPASGEHVSHVQRFWIGGPG